MNFSADQVVTLALERLAVAGKGVMLLHDIDRLKTALAFAGNQVERRLKRLQYPIVHAVLARQSGSSGEVMVPVSD